MTPGVQSVPGSDFTLLFSSKGKVKFESANYECT